MNKKIIAGAVFIGIASLVTTFALPAFAATRPKASVSTVITRGDKEISNRIDALNALTTKISGMKKISDANKTSLNAEVSAQISELNALKEKIDAETVIKDAQADISTIAKNYRIYMLVVPQVNTMASVDKIQAIFDNLTALTTKFQTRISAAQASGADVTALQTTLADFTAKATDANALAQTALTAVSSLTPDKGDATLSASNKTALMGAHKNIVDALADITAARKDAQSLSKALKDMQKTSDSTKTQ